PDHQRPSRRRLLAYWPDAGSEIPVGPCPRSQARAGRIAEDRKQDPERPAGGHKFFGRLRRQEKRRRQGWLIDEGFGGFAVPALIEEGRAKVNLTLRVVGRRVDGYHDLESLVAFADCADRLTLAPGAELKLITTGPLVGECGDASDKLVLRAARLLAERVPGLKLGEFTLDKVLPVAAGIGGGSADAAAAL